MQKLISCCQRPGLMPLALLVISTVIILAHHFYRVQHSDLSRWKGGGMGMFSTQDAPGTRTLALMIHSDQGSFLASQDSLGRAGTRFTAMPTADNLHSLCVQMATKTWYALGSVRTVTLNDQSLRSLPMAGTASDSLANPRPLQVSALSLTSWKTRIDVAQRQIERRSLGEARWSRAEGCDVF
ncbi:hypothetical protein MWU49_11620 [Alcanivorax sp. S6407]|uniref:hypothetical protein n=1 Tax=Alcanivorax sp. S6407 TaxID=2926424 RepID=UPI001FF1A710|nr:hypothetical protein [Alcanivorax sp. S6407]MCK0154354.1 hypothetical protein [Alcanivorax sp. S6407]